MNVRPATGEIYELFFNEGNVNNATIHIRAIVDNEMVVFRRWSEHKTDWTYEIVSIYWFIARAEHLSIVHE